MLAEAEPLQKPFYYKMYHLIFENLYELSNDAKGTNALFIGIENNSALYHEAAGRINADNVLLVNENFEEKIREFQNKTIDKVIMILPDPKYIDPQYHADWISLYANIFLKLKDLGILEITCLLVSYAVAKDHIVIPGARVVKETVELIRYRRRHK